MGNGFSKISAVIFDCDGVMFDSREANIHYYNAVLKHFGLSPLRDKDISYVHMHTADESIRYIFRGTPFVESAMTYRLKMDYTPFIRNMSMEPGLMELLRHIRPHFGLAVATNRSNTIEEVLKFHGLARYFDIVVCSLDVKRPKPHPECLVKILRFFQIGPERALYIGDSAVDSETARRARVSFVSYKNPSLEADHHANCLDDIAALLKKGPSS